MTKKPGNVRLLQYEVLFNEVYLLYSPSGSAEVKECVQLYLHSPDTPSWRGAQLKKAQGQLYLYLYLIIIIIIVVVVVVVIIIIIISLSHLPMSRDP
jgi:hypothetical protein